MYKPAPPRPRKTKIVRARTGCKGCRQRRTKCDEQKPSCGTCTRLGRPCDPVSPKLEFRAVSYPSKGSPTQPKPAVYDKGRPCRPTSRGSDGSLRQLNLIDHSYCGWAADQIGQALSDLGLSPANAISPSIDETWTIGLDYSSPLYEASIGDIPRAISPRSNSSYGDPAFGFTLPIPASISSSQDPQAAIYFYADAWKSQCLPALNLAFHQLQALPDPHLLSTGIIVALSSCRLSRTLPQRKLSNISSIPSLCFKPDAGHESVSHEYYGTVMRKVASWSDQDFDSYPTLGLAVLVLFCYLESSMGNFRAFRLHSDGTKRLIQSYEDHVIGDSRGVALLAAWAEVEMQNWWRRIYFSTPDFQRNHASLSLQPKLEAVLSTENHHRAAVLLILCESHRLNSAAVVARWDELANNDPHSDGNTSPMSQERAHIEESPWRSHYSASLKVESEKLDAWYGLLPVAELPEALPGGLDRTSLQVASLDIQPLKFRCHIAAMNFAYYLVARVMQCTGPLESLDSSSQGDAAFEEAEAWTLMLLSVTAGVDWEQCVKLNVFTVGLCGLLLACALRSRNLAIGIWIQEWMEAQLKGDVFEEGNFPVFQTLSALRLVNRERKEGRDVFALFQTVDDGGGTGKLGSYHSQRLGSLWVYGRCRRTGQLFSYCRDVEEIA